MKRMLVSACVPDHREGLGAGLGQTQMALT